MIVIEFCLAFIPFMLLVLGLAQMMLLHAGRLATMHAANAAVRAAVVILDDDPRHYGGEARGSAESSSQRLSEIQRAAAGAMVGVWPGVRNATDEATVSNAIKVPPRHGVLPELLSPQGATAQLVRVTVENDAASESIMAEVFVRYPCLVPLARRVLCRNENTIPLNSRARLPHQGATYAYGSP